MLVECMVETARVQDQAVHAEGRLHMLHVRTAACCVTLRVINRKTVWVPVCTSTALSLLQSALSLMLATASARRAELQLFARHHYKGARQQVWVAKYKGGWCT